MKTNERLRFADTGGKPRDWQGRSIRCEQRIRRDVRLNLGVHLLLERLILEDRFNDEVCTCGIGSVRRCIDPVKDLVSSFGCHPSARDCLVENSCAICLALFSRLNSDILQHNLHACAGADVGDSSTHHSGAKHHNLGCPELVIAVGTSAALCDLLKIKEERLNHVLGDLTGQQINEILRLDLVGSLKVNL